MSFIVVAIAPAGAIAGIGLNDPVPRDNICGQMICIGVATLRLSVCGSSVTADVGIPMGSKIRCFIAELYESSRLGMGTP
jgi:hypothetical protein